MKTNPSLRYLVAFILLCPLSAFNQSRQNWITVYTDDFSGFHYDLEPGRYDNTYLIQSGLSHISSIKVPPGMKVTLFSEDNYRGYTLTLTEDARTRYLEAKGFAKTELSVSMVVQQLPDEKVPLSGPVITIYQNNFSGAAKNLSAGNYESFEFGHIDNDQISSVAVPRGMRVTLFEHKNFGGRSLVLTQDASADQLIKNKFNDVTTSLRVENLAVDTVTKTVSEVKPIEKTPKDSVAVVKEAKPKGTFITLYEGDFTGKSKYLVPGRYDAEQIGIGDNQLSSIQVPRGMKVTLYENESFKGRSFEVKEKNATLRDFNIAQFDDLTSSLIVEEIPRVTVYDHNLAGESFQFDPGVYNVNDLGIGNDAVSSVSVPPGQWVLLFDNEAFQGKSILLTQTTTNEALKKVRFDNITSSLLVGNDQTPLPEAILYQEDYAGASKKLTPGFYKAEELGIGNNAVSSVRVPRGLRVTLFDMETQEGRKMMITKSTSKDFFTSSHFDDIASAVLVELIRPEEMVVTIFDGSYRGASQMLGPGKYRANDITIGNKALSSVRVPPGMSVMLYERDNCTGSSTTIMRDTDFGGSKLFDNYYSSVVVEDVTEPFVTPLPTPPAAPKPVVDSIAAPVELPAAPSEPACTLTDKEYYTALKTAEAKAFSQEKMNTVRLATEGKCLTNEQVRGLAGVFDFEEQTLEFVKYAYDLAQEKSTYYTLEDVFKFMSSKEAFNTFLRSR